MLSIAYLRNLLVVAEEELAEIQLRIPAHSIRPHQMMELEEAEEKVSALKRKITEALKHS